MKYKGLASAYRRKYWLKRRVAATPETAARFCSRGARVLVQSGQVPGAFFHDEDYTATVELGLLDDVRRGSFPLRRM